MGLSCIWHSAMKYLPKKKPHHEEGGLVVLIGDSGVWYNLGNIRKRMEFSLRHTKVIVINGGVSFLVMVKQELLG